MTSWMKPTAPPAGRAYEDGLSTEELRAALEVEGADISAGTADEIRAYLCKRIDAIAARNRRSCFGMEFGPQKIWIPAEVRR